MYQTSTRPARKTATRTVKKYLAASIGSMFVRPHNNYGQRRGFVSAPMMDKAAVMRKPKMPKGLMSAVVSTMATTVICASIVMSEPVYAGWLQEFYDDNTVNLTHAQKYHTGNVTGYTGGAVVWRMKRQGTPSLIQFDPPRLKAGCSGIDMYLGSFSFIDKDEFIEALRNAGQQALAGLFLGAVKAMSPLIGGIIEYLQDVINKINNLNRDWCGMGAQIGEYYTTAAMKGLGLSDAELGEAPDISFGMKQYFGDIKKTILNEDKKNYFTTNPRTMPLQDIVKKGCYYPRCNIVFFALAKKYGQNVTTDRDFFMTNAEYTMSLVGVNEVKVDDPTGESEQGIEHKSRGPTYTTRLLSGLDVTDTERQFKITCARNDDSTCSPTDVREITGNNKENFYKSYKLIYEKLKAAVSSRTRPDNLDSQELQKLAKTRIPLWRLAAIAGTPGVFMEVAKDQEETFIRTAALDAAIQLVNFHLDEIWVALKDIEEDTYKKNEGQKTLYEGYFKAIYENISNEKKAMQKLTLDQIKGKESPQDLLAAISKAEQFVYSSINLTLAENMRFSSGRY
jgi:hypothetical protein